VEGVNQKGKRTPVKTRPTRGLGWPVGAVSACGGNEASGLVGRKAGWAARSVGLKIRKKNFRIKNWIFEFTKALEICRRRFRRNFEVGIFPKFF
jgi:hypothetical protein